MDELSRQMDELEKEFGYVVGDFNTECVFDTALQLRGQEMFVDLLENAELVPHLFAVVAETQAQIASYVRPRTGTSSVWTNRSILNVTTDLPAQRLLCANDFPWNLRPGTLPVRM